MQEISFCFIHHKTSTRDAFSSCQNPHFLLFTQYVFFLPGKHFFITQHSFFRGNFLRRNSFSSSNFCTLIYFVSQFFSLLEKFPLILNIICAISETLHLSPYQCATLTTNYYFPLTFFYFDFFWLSVEIFVEHLLMTLHNATDKCIFSFILLPLL